MNTQITLTPRATGSEVNAVITTRATGQMHDIVAVKIIRNSHAETVAFAESCGYRLLEDTRGWVGGGAVRYELAAR